MRKISFGVLVLILLCGCSVYREATSAETEDKQKEKTELISVDDRLPSMTLKLRNSVMKACENGKYGAIDETGTLVVPLEYDQLTILSDGQILAETANQYTLYNAAGMPQELTAVNQQVTNWDSFRFDLTLNLFRVEKEGRYAVMNFAGELLTEQFYDEVQRVLSVAPCSSEAPVFLAAERNENGYEVNLYTSAGKQITSKSYKQTSADGVFDVSYYEDHAGGGIVAIRNRDSYDGIDLNGNLLFSGADHVEYNESVDALIVEKDGKSAILKQAGQKVDFIYDRIQRYTDQSVIITQAGKSGILDAEGKIILPVSYDEVLYLYGLPELTEFNVRNGAQRQVIDQEGNVLFEHHSDELYKEGNYYAMRGTGGTMDSQGHVVSPDLNLYRYNGKDRYTGEIHGISCLLDENLEIIQQFPDLDWISTVCSGTRCSQNYFQFLRESIHYGVMDRTGEILFEDAEIEQRGDVTLISAEEKIICAADSLTQALPASAEAAVHPTEIQGVSGIFIGEAGNLTFYDLDLKPLYTVAADRIVLELPVFETEDGTKFKEFIIEKDGKQGVMLETGEMILEPVYEELLHFYWTGYGMAVNQGKAAVFDFRGNWITDFVYTLNENFKIHENRIVGEWYTNASEGEPAVYQRERDITDESKGS